MKRITIKYVCGACGWPWRVDRKAPMDLDFPQPAPTIVVPRDVGPCECEPTEESDNGER